MSGEDARSRKLIYSPSRSNLKNFYIKLSILSKFSDFIATAVAMAKQHFFQDITYIFHLF